MKGDFSYNLDTPLVGDDPDRPPKRYVPADQIRKLAIWFVVFIGVATITLAVLLWRLTCIASLATGSSYPNSMTAFRRSI